MKSRVTVVKHKDTKTRRCDGTPSCLCVFVVNTLVNKPNHV
jgi:hypothetical protein